jgi:2-amino-4-hydroxy-6-hydroxymethyldihydropteridine diphosphokinase
MQHHDRTIDIDLISYDAITMNTPELILPHPRMKERDFVMRPLEEIS